MKPAPIFTFLLISAAAAAQEPQQKKQVTIETEHEHKGASHTSTRTTGTPEHKSHAEWHYHSGQKRPQVPYDTLPAQREVSGTDADYKKDSSWHHKHR